jgi:hypothetical protein
MIIEIFKVYGFTINTHIFREFFNHYAPGNIRDINDVDGIRIEGRIFNYLDHYFNHVIDENTRFVMEKLIRVIIFRIGITEILGILDFIPVVGFIIPGVINSIINIQFLNNIVNETKRFLTNRIRNSGANENILNIIHGYRDSVSILENLRNKNEWTRKIRIMNE